jgi:Tfp pilus assembly protein PilX
MMAKSAQFHNRKSDTRGKSRLPFPARGERGVALLISLMLLTLLSVMSLVMVMTISPDMLINGYYGNYRGSFYAADSGLNITRQAVVNQLQGYVNTTSCAGWGANVPANLQTTCGKAPFNTSDNTTNLTTAAQDAASAVIASALATSGGYGSFSSLNSGTAATSWPGSFELVNTTNCPSTLTLVSAAPSAGGTNNTPYTAYTYQFNYKLCSLGRAQSAQQVYTSENGAITLVITASGAASQNTSFSAFGAFISNYAPNSAPLVPGTFEGPSFTNGAWQFEAGGAYTFTGPVGSANANLDYYINGNWYDSSNTSYTSGGTKIAPTFEGPVNLGQTPLTLPPNDFSQKWAVLDGQGCGEGGTTCGGTVLPPVPGLPDMTSHLKDINGNAYASSGTAPSSGVFLPYSCTGSGSACTSSGVMNGGGIYVEGNASVGLTLGTDSNGNLTQTYTITQGSTTTTVTTTVGAQPNASYTKVVSGSKTVTLSGVPMNKVPTQAQQGTMLYVDGNITALSGPGQGVPSIQDGSQVTIVANGNVNITGDIIYKHEANTLDTSDTYLPQNNTQQVLGVFTASGNIVLSSPYSNQNLQVDGALAPLGNNSNCGSNSCGFLVNGHINTFNNYGAQSQTNIFGASMNTQNTWYDTRFATGFGPPWFPATIVNQSDIALGPPTVTPTVIRMSWTTSPQ